MSSGELPELLIKLGLRDLGSGLAVAALIDCLAHAGVVDRAAVSERIRGLAGEVEDRNVRCVMNCIARVTDGLGDRPNDRANDRGRQLMAMLNTGL